MSAEPLNISAVFAEIQPAASLDAGALDAASGLLSLLRNALVPLQSEQVLELHASAPSINAELVSWCRLNDCHLIAQLDAGDHQRYLIAKGDRSAQWPAPDTHISLPRRDHAPDLRDAFVGRRAVIPTEAPLYLGFVPRGAVPETGLPPYPFSLNKKTDVWFEEIAALYEQSVANQWNASRDIPWSDLHPLPDDLERAVCQLMTFLAENEYAALYVPSKFLPRINAQYIEVVLFLASVINDEARHIEVFTKRALSNGGGLQYSTALTQHSLLGLLVQEDYFRASFLLHVLGEGTFLDLLGFIELHSPDSVTREIVRRARFDERRHVAYGLGHARDRLRADPTLAGQLESAAVERASSLQEVAGGNPFVAESLAVLAGGGRNGEQLDRGMQAVRDLQHQMHANRMRHMIQIGLEPSLAQRISDLHTPNYM